MENILISVFNSYFNLSEILTHHLLITFISYSCRQTPQLTTNLSMCQAIQHKPLHVELVAHACANYLNLRSDMNLLSQYLSTEVSDSF